MLSARFFWLQGFLISNVHPLSSKNNAEKNNMLIDCIFRAIPTITRTQNFPTQNCLFRAITPSFYSFSDTKESCQYKITTRLSGDRLPSLKQIGIIYLQALPAPRNSALKVRQ